MRNYLNLNNIVIAIFILLEILNCCFVFIPEIRIFNIKTHQYISVVFAALFSLFQVRKLNFNHLAFLFIVIADLFLTLLRPQILELGLLFFILSQVCFAIMIYLDQKEKSKLPNLITRITLSVIGVLVVGIVSKWNLILILTTIYGVNVILNLVCSLMKQKINWLLSVGLILFILCDVSIGLNAGIDMGMFPEEGDAFYNFIAGISFNTGWLYYIPCLTLLSLHVIMENKENKKTY